MIMFQIIISLYFNYIIVILLSNIVLRYYYVMLISLIVVTLLCGYDCTLNADLYLLSYSPLTFKLSFGQEIPLPKFQIMQNFEVMQTNFMGQTNQNSSQFIFTATIQKSQDAEENYYLLFNQPLSIANGNLNLQDYFITPKRVNIERQIPQWLQIFLQIMIIICCLSNCIGFWVFDFILIYLITPNQFNFKVKWNDYLSNILFITIDTSQSGDQQIIQMIGPLLIILGSMILGLIIKKLLEDKTALIPTAIRRGLAYNFPMILATIYMYSIFFNALKMMKESINNTFKGSSTQENFGLFLSYISIFLVIFFFYLQTMIVNPRIGQSIASWDKFCSTSENFRELKCLHEGLNLHYITKRNFNAYASLKRIIIIMSWFLFHSSFIYAVIILELIQVIYAFIIRPFNSKFHNNLLLVFRLISFLFFFMIMEAQIYFSVTQNLTTHLSVINFLEVKIVLFAFISIGTMLVSLYKLYQSVSSFQKKAKWKKEQQEYKDHLQMRQRSFSIKVSGPEGQRRKNSRDLSSGSKSNRQASIDNSEKTKSKNGPINLEMQSFQYSYSNESKIKKDLSKNKQWGKVTLLEQIGSK